MRLVSASSCCMLPHYRAEGGYSIGSKWHDQADMPTFLCRDEQIDIICHLEVEEYTRRHQKCGNTLH